MKRTDFLFETIDKLANAFLATLFVSLASGILDDSEAPNQAPPQKALLAGRPVFLRLVLDPFGVFHNGTFRELPEASNVAASALFAGTFGLAHFPQGPLFVGFGDLGFGSLALVVVVGKDHGVGWYCSSSTGEEVLTVYRPSTRIHGHCQA